MTEWRLFDEGTVPIFCTEGFFNRHPWVPPGDQVGHAERTRMVADLVAEFRSDARTLSDLGCGDGSLLAMIRDLGLKRWGYDAGWANVHRAQGLGLPVTYADFLTEPVEYGDIVVMSEVLEHLLDPHGLLKSLPDCRLIVSSPAAETDQWHYIHHAWAWDEDGYAKLLTDAGWKIVEHRSVAGGIAEHMGERREQRFQAIVAQR